MPTKTRTDAEIVEILATKGMGWTRRDDMWMVIEEGEWSISGGYDWNPLEDLNAIREVEERLTVEQRQRYIRRLFKHPTAPKPGSQDGWFIRHVPPRTCCEVLAKVLTETPAAPAASK